MRIIKEKYTGHIRRSGPGQTETKWKKFEEGGLKREIAVSNADKVGMVENGEPKKRMFTRDQGWQVSKRTESLNMPSFF